MKKSIILSLVFMLIACFSSLAAIKVNGIVVDSLSLEPEPMVTIRIMQQGNDTPVALGTTDDNGVFSIELKGKGQYTRLAANNKMMVARENGVRFLVNFTDYLDTGIFLDHRPVRMMIQEMAKDKRFLNLFCYTGTATLNAIKGGALSTVSVDASSTYLAWMEENLKLNGYSTVFGNLLYKSDVIDWLWDTYDKFDLIFCDPPTFSNSKDRRGSFDVQRDHVKLIDAAAMHLSPGGTLIFSNNYRKFKLDPEVMEKYVVEDITEKTIGDDFKRDMKIHHCYLIRKKIKVKISANHKPRRRS